MPATERPRTRGATSRPGPEDTPAAGSGSARGPPRPELGPAPAPSQNDRALLVLGRQLEETTGRSLQTRATEEVRPVPEPLRTQPGPALLPNSPKALRRPLARREVPVIQERLLRLGDEELVPPLPNALVPEERLLLEVAVVEDAEAVLEAAGPPGCDASP